MYWRSLRQIVSLKTVLRIGFTNWSVQRFLRPSVGRAYGVGFLDKMRLLLKVHHNSVQPGSASSFSEQLTVVRYVLQIPKDTEGAVAEFGCYKGASTASLSLACALTGRRLVVFDSFEGLPEPEEIVSHLGTGKQLPYKAGDYCGTLDEVKRNVGQWGNIEVCEFVKGFFDQTLPRRDPNERYALVFEDADLPRSVRDVIRWVWPRLQKGCAFFCHEARDLEVVSVFYDDAWWQSTLGCRAPGFIGSGLGLPVDIGGSQLGYSVQLSDGSSLLEG